MMKTLFESIQLTKLDVKNRFVRSATWEELADEKGHLTDELIKTYETLANGGVGTIITGYSTILESDRPSPKMMGIYDDSFIDEYRKLTEKVHESGVKIIMQIVHGGFKPACKVDEREITAPSGVPNIEKTRAIAKEMSHEEINEVVQAFADAAVRVKKAGFDGVQLHMAHGFLLNQFLSPYFNRRTDEYGGIINNRAEIVYDVYRAVRQAVGDDYPVLAKINCDDFMDDGFAFKDSLYVCQILSKMGIDAIEVSGGSYSSRDGEGPSRCRLDTPEKESYFREYAAKIAESVEAPVLLVGGNRNLQTMENILNSTSIAGFSLARPLLREPDLINRWQSGDLEKAKCISCNQCFVVEGSRHCKFTEGALA